MNSQWEVAVLGGVAGGLVVVLALTAALWLMGVQPILAQPSPGVAGREMTAPSQIAATPTPTPSRPITHEQMHKMMDAMQGAGASDRMHEAMGADAEKLMDQCVGMMNMTAMMQGGQGLMGGGGMQGMMGGR